MFLFSGDFETKQIPTILNVLENLFALLYVVFHQCCFSSMFLPLVSTIDSFEEFCTELLKMTVYLYCLRDATEENHPPFPNFHQDRLILGPTSYMTREQL